MYAQRVLQGQASMCIALVNLRLVPHLSGTFDTTLRARDEREGSPNYAWVHRSDHRRRVRLESGEHLYCVAWQDTTWLDCPSCLFRIWLSESIFVILPKAPTRSARYFPHHVSSTVSHFTRQTFSASCPLVIPVLSVGTIFEASSSVALEEFATSGCHVQ